MVSTIWQLPSSRQHAPGCGQLADPHGVSFWKLPPALLQFVIEPWAQDPLLKQHDPQNVAPHVVSLP
jgi:hypothetical protein